MGGPKMQIHNNAAWDHSLLFSSLVYNAHLHRIAINPSNKQSSTLQSVNSPSLTLDLGVFPHEVSGLSKAII